MHETNINQTYRKELFGSLMLYVVVLFTSIWFAKDMADGAARTLVALTPALPIFAALWAVVRHFQRMDEYLRIWNLELIAIAGAITALSSVTYGFMEGIGFPRLSMFVIWPLFVGSWGVLACLRKWLESRERN